MASRFIVASGVWDASNTAIWSATDNGPPGASVPTASDRVNSSTSGSPRTITLGSDITVSEILLRGDILNAGTYNVTAVGSGGATGGVSFGFGSTANMGSGTWTVGGSFGLSGTSSTVNAQTSTVIFQSGQISSTNATYNNFIIQLNGTNATIAGNINFSSLKVESLSSNTNNRVLITSGSVVNATRLSLKGYGSSSANERLKIERLSGASPTISYGNGGNSIVAGKNLTISNITFSGSGIAYAGATSTDGGGNTAISFVDAPLSQSLQDTFTGSTINSTLWSTSTSGIGYVAQSGGAITLSPGSGSGFASLISKTQYLLESSYVKFKADLNGLNNVIATAYISNASSQYNASARRNIPDIYISFYNGYATFTLDALTTYNYSHIVTSDDVYWRVRESSGVLYFESSRYGITYTTLSSVAASTYGLDTTQLIARPIIDVNPVSGSGQIVIDDFNIDVVPTANFTATPVIGSTPLSTTFTDMSNFPADTWLWDFGDSTTSTSQNPSKTYSAAGSYTVSLSASNSTQSDTETKVAYITVSPNVYNKEAKGTLLLGGGATRTAVAYKEAKGGLVLGGEARAFIRKNTGQIEEKIYLAKVYDEDGTFLEVWKNDQISEPSFSQEINEIGSVMTLELARNSDSLATTTEPLQTEAGTTITTESGLPILASTESRNQVGPGSAVNHNNRVDIFVFYGGVEPLLTELGEEILTEDGEVLLAVNGAPNGKRIFTGFISDINSRYGSTETTAIELSSYGWDLGQWPITTDTGDTTVPFNSYEPSEMVRESIDKFQSDSTGFGTFTTRTTTSVSDTGTVTSYTFKVNTYEEVLDKAIELMPEGWYYYIGLGDNTVYFREKSTEPNHTFYLGKHIKDLDLRSYIGDATNRVIFTGGGDPALLKDYVEAPASRTRRRLERISDGRVELESSADLISEGTIDEKNKVQYRTTIEILSKQYDIESINIGDMVGFRNFGNYVDALVMQIVGLTYTPDIITLQLDTKIPSINKRIDDIVRNLKVTENLTVPDAPTV